MIKLCNSVVYRNGSRSCSSSFIAARDIEAFTIRKYDDAKSDPSDLSLNYTISHGGGLSSIRMLISMHDVANILDVMASSSHKLAPSFSVE